MQVIIYTFYNTVLQEENTGSPNKKKHIYYHDGDTNDWDTKVFL